jgi:hypothetical protein
MNRRQSFISHAQSTKLVQPCDGAFDHPSGLAQMAAVGTAALGDLVSDSTYFQRQPMLLAVVSTIGLHAPGLMKHLSALACDGSRAFYQWHELGDVMPVGLGQNHIDRDALRIDEKMVFAPRLAAIGWVRSSFFPHGLHAPKNCRRQREKNPICRHSAVWSAARGAVEPTRRLFARHAVAASASCPSRNPSLAAAFPMVCRTAIQTECP